MVPIMKGSVSKRTAAEIGAYFDGEIERLSDLAHRSRCGQLHLDRISKATSSMISSRV